MSPALNRMLCMSNVSATDLGSGLAVEAGANQPHRIVMQLNSGDEKRSPNSIFGFITNRHVSCIMCVIDPTGIFIQPWIRCAYNGSGARLMAQGDCFVPLFAVR
jgi:hypothetical protein